MLRFHYPKIGDFCNVFSLKRVHTHFLAISPSGNAVFFVFLMSTTVDIYSDFIT